MYISITWKVNFPYFFAKTSGTNGTKQFVEFRNKTDLIESYLNSLCLGKQILVRLHAINVTVIPLKLTFCLLGLKFVIKNMYDGVLAYFLYSHSLKMQRF